MLSPGQLTALRAYIDADPALAAIPNTHDGAFEIARLMMLPTDPAFIVWKSNVALDDVGEAFVATSLASMTSGNNDRLVSFALYNPQGVNPSRVDHRAFFDDVFSPASGAPTRTSLAALWRRTASRFESLFATGTGSDASPATLVEEGSLAYVDVVYARAL